MEKLQKLFISLKRHQQPLVSVFPSDSENEGTMLCALNLKQMFVISSFIDTLDILWSSFCNVFSFMIVFVLHSLVFPLELFQLFWVMPEIE